MIKISGLRYVIALFETFLNKYRNDYNTNNQLAFDENYIKNLVSKLEEMKMTSAGTDWNTGDTLFSCKLFSLSFRGEGATWKMAETDAEDFTTFLNSQQTNVNPFASI